MYMKRHLIRFPDSNRNVTLTGLRAKYFSMIFSPLRFDAHSYNITCLIHVLKSTSFVHNVVKQAWLETGDISSWLLSNLPSFSNKLLASSFPVIFSFVSSSNFPTGQFKNFGPIYYSEGGSHFHSKQSPAEPLYLIWT